MAEARGRRPGESSSRRAPAYRPSAAPFGVRPSELHGCFVLDPRVARDERGSFVKTFHAEAFLAHRLATGFVEQFYTVSGRGVLRGMHLQLPPHEHAKLVYCVAGTVLDVALDVRGGSPTYGRHLSIELSAEQPRALYLPPGIAHGFYTLSESATLVYNVTSVHAPGSDAGIRWDSFGFAWPGAAPTLSARDRALPALDEFDTPFVFPTRP
jgi:dTDP-4-dehydrorhamnose 3,5-epimerase